ncbi:S-layer homology domain-containing protein [uncultured Oscillibacter sp.]|uniref:S-layer homology domain-containing protein n=1 Tax=uncultured Oscillibacter sp. TaxID=876091 RepID=UPI0025F532B3|nr:S-layer homology domain-containing protein [uncultured Oscillibacter sp.]
MKKRILSLALALALCLGLVTPAIAADTSGLDTTTKKLYYDVLTAEISKHGIVSSSGGSGVEYAALEDMDANGIPELITVRYTDGLANINVWTIRNGKAVQTVDEEVSAGGTLTEANIFLARKSGQIVICDSFEWYERGYEWSGGEDLLIINIHYADGRTEKIRTDDETAVDTKWKEFNSTWTKDSFYFGGGNGLWLHDDKAAEAVKQVQTALTDKAKSNPAPAAGTYGRYSIVDPEGYFEISFDLAKVEKTTVQYRKHWIVPTKEYIEPYSNINVTLVTLKSGSNINISISDEEVENVQYSLTKDGRNKYTYYPSTADFIGDDFYMAFLSSNGDEFKGELRSHSVLIHTNNESYIIEYETAAKPSTSGFTDVKSGAYYADSVKWAVDKKITSGTSATTFSPDSTCTVAQILTFLWRANGSPEPTGRNPFSDISSSDYFYKAAIWAANKGLVIGNKFNGNAPCTRSMVVTYLWKLAGSPSMNVAGGYGPQTISGVTFDGKSCSIDFSAATLEKATVTTKILTEAEVGYDTINMVGPATIVTVSPGSKLTLKGAASVSAYEYIVENSRELLEPDSQMGTVISSGSVENAFSEFADSYFPIALKLLKDKNENQYIMVMGSNSVPSITSSGFTDVPSSAAYAQAVAWAVEKGITAGTSNTTFSPNATCTRGQIVTFLHRAMGK